MLILLLSFIAAGRNFVSAAPTALSPRTYPELESTEIVNWPHIDAPTDCPGYEASNVVKTDSSLTADLTLAGAACNAYSDDLTNLKLVVEYQTGKLHSDMLYGREC